MSTKWTDEEKTEVIAKYQERLAEFETPSDKAANSMEVIMDIAKEHDKTPNGVRIILVQAEVYIKKEATSAKVTTGSTGGTKRVNKAEAQQELSNAIALIDEDLVSAEIIDKLTGKAAQYFTEVLQKAATVQD